MADDLSRTHASLLLRLADHRDGAAWSEFCRRYGALIAGFARRLGVQPSDQDDALQEVLAALAQAMPGFRYDPEKGRFRGYLKAATVHAVQRLRQKRHASRLGELPSAFDAADDDASNDDAFEAEWRQYHLREAMRTIAVEFNEADRAAFAAYAIEGKDARATAQSLGLSVDQVYQAKSRILKRLEALIAEQVAVEG